MYLPTAATAKVAPDLRGYVSGPELERLLGWRRWEAIKVLTGRLPDDQRPRRDASGVMHFPILAVETILGKQIPGIDRSQLDEPQPEL